MTPRPAPARPHRPGTRSGPGRGAVPVAATLLLVAALLGACSTTTEPTATPGTGPPASSADPVTDLDQSLRSRTSVDGIGAVVRLVQHGTSRFDRTYGDLTGTTPIRIASASKWLTAATVLTLVDEQRLSLDAPIGDLLPAFTGDKAAITLRQLLSHTSGIDNNGCIWDRDTTMAACVDAIAADDLVEAPGRRFHYGNTSFQVAARLAEVASGQSFSDLFRARLAEPLGLSGTRFDEGQATENPTPAASGESTADDYGRFLAMLLAGGVHDGRRILSESSVAEILHTQVAGMENERDGAVQITGVPDYGFGCWLDELGPDGASVVASGSGSLGAYPFVDRAHDAYGMIWLEDDAHGDGRAVQRSQAQARLALRLLS